MEKIILIGQQKEYNYTGKEVLTNVFCKIKIHDGKLSITGVIGPMSNGNALGSCGQIYDSINIEKFNKGWNEKILNKFINMWCEWHLNDMKPYTEDMKKKGWDKLAEKPIYKHSLIRKDDEHKRLLSLEKQIIDNALNNENTNLTDEEKRLLQSERFIDFYSYDEELQAFPEFMQAHKDYRTGKPKTEKKSLGWVNPSEHKDGLLGKKLDKDGYGSKWYFHALPNDIIGFLESLPDSEKRPAWI